MRQILIIFKFNLLFVYDNTVEILNFVSKNVDRDLLQNPECIFFIKFF